MTLTTTVAAGCQPHPALVDVAAHQAQARARYYRQRLLLHQAPQILALHDEALRGFGLELEQTLVVGSTEHAAAQLLPELATSLNATFPECRIRFRIDRGAQLKSGLADSRIDLALLLGPPEDPTARIVGELELTGTRRRTGPRLLPANPSPWSRSTPPAPCAVERWRPWPRAA